MKKTRRLIFVLAAIVSLAATATVLAESLNFNTHVAAREEVMPVGIVNGSLAQGQALFKLSDDGTTIEYKLIAANINNVVAAHIHIAAAGVNGPVVQWLFPGTSPGGAPAGGGRTDGVIAEGSFTAATFVGPLAGAQMSALVEAIQAGNAYVNIHTNDGVGAVNTGPGDFPGGEIRGQLETHDH